MTVLLITSRVTKLVTSLSQTGLLYVLIRLCSLRFKPKLDFVLQSDPCTNRLLLVNHQILDPIGHLISLLSTTQVRPSSPLAKTIETRNLVSTKTWPKTSRNTSHP